MKRIFAIYFAAAFFLTQGSSFALADEEEGPYYVQLLSFMLNAEQNGQRSGQVPTTPYLTTATKESAEIICQKFSHVREAVVGTAFNAVVPIEKGAPIYTEIEAQMKRAINRSLRKRLVSQVTLMLGAHPMGQGVSSKLPYNAMGCRALTELPTLEDIRKARSGR